MNVAFLARYLNLVDGGGSSYSLDAIATELSARGHDVDVFITQTLNTKSDLPYHFEMLDFNENAKSASRFLKIANLRSNLFDNYDVVHLFNPAFLPPVGYSLRSTESESFYVGRLNSYTLFCSNFALMDGDCHRKCGVIEKFVHSKQDGLANLKRSPRYLTQTYLEHRFTSNIDMLFAQSPQIKQIYEDYGFSNEIQVVPNFVEDFQFVCSRNPTGDLRRILYVGRVERHKGIHILLESLNHIEEPIHLDIVGKGSIRRQLEQKYCPQNTHSVEFHGYIPHEELSSFYSNADLFIHPGLWPEPFGNTILEAMQHDCPILSSDIGAPPWLAGDAGVTFSRGDPKSLAEKVTYLIENDEQVKNLRENCKHRVAKFNKKEVVNQIEHLYNYGLK